MEKGRVMEEILKYFSSIAFEPSMLFQNIAAVMNTLILFGGKKKEKEYVG